MTYARRTPSPSAVSSYSAPDRLEDGLALLGRSFAQIAAREDEVEEPVAVEQLLERELGGLDRAEEPALVEDRARRRTPRSSRSR